MENDMIKNLEKNAHRIPDPQRYSEMKYRHAGISGLKLSEISLGLWHNFGSVGNFENMREMIFTAFDHGITMFDLANNYGPRPGSAEENFGRILRENFSAYRDEMLISTKAGFDMWDGPYGIGGSAKYLTASLDQSLKRLGVDYVDIFYHHCPDPETPLEETCYALSRAVQAGKALYVGISNYSSEQSVRAVKILKELKCPVVLNQVCYNLLNRSIEEDRLKECAEQSGYGIIVFSPLSQGLLTDRYKDEIPPDSRMRNSRFLNESALTPSLRQKVSALRKVAEARNQTLAELALSWLLKDRIVTSVIIGASSPQQILENIKINPTFTPEELSKIDEICKS